MQIPRKFLTFIPLLLLIAAPIGSMLAQATPTPLASSSDVAILVVDVFEEPVEETIFKESLSDGNTDNPNPLCAISLDGQDGAAIRGTSVTSSLHPYALPHGRLVFKHFQTILSASYTAGSPNDPTAPTEQTWTTNNGTIWLRAVDTKEYNINSIASEVAAAVTDLNGQGVERFVINMSFALVPCSEIPEVDVTDYQKTLSDFGIVCDPSQPISGFNRLVCELDPGTVDPDTFEQNLIATRDSGVAEDAVAYSILQLAVMRPKVQQALAASISGTPDGPGPEFKAFIEELPQGVSVIQVASAGNDGKAYPYFPALSANVLSVGADYSVSSCSLTSASVQDIENYLISKGVRKNVHDVAVTILTPQSNSAEVIADGNTMLTPNDYFNPPPTDADVLGCLYGTSFAAPQVSVLMAVDQQVRASTECAAPQPPGTVFSPPLAYKQWDNLDIPTAASLYCVDFPLS